MGKQKRLWIVPALLAAAVIGGSAVGSAQSCDDPVVAEQHRQIELQVGDIRVQVQEVERTSRFLARLAFLVVVFGGLAAVLQAPSQKRAAAKWATAVLGVAISIITVATNTFVGSGNSGTGIPEILALSLTP